MDKPPGQGISVSLRVARAMSLARQGRVKEAQAMLAPDGIIPEDPLSLEVLAVMVTSEGDYLRALQLWGQLRQRAPNHPEAKRMIAAIELWLTRPSWARYVPFFFGTLVAALMVGIFVALTWESPRPPRVTVPAGRVPDKATPVPPTRSTPLRPNEPGPSSTKPEVNFINPKSQQPRRP